MELSIPIHDELWRFLKSCPKDRDTFIETVFGSARSEKAFTGWIKDAKDAAGITAQASPHGLRKAACRRLAEAQATAPEIMAITGHRNINEVMTYIREADQKRLSIAAMAKMTGAFDKELPNQFEGLGESDDNLLKSLIAKGGLARPTGLEPVFPP